MDMEDNRTGSADSENGSSDSYVQVTQEDAREDSQAVDPISETAQDLNPDEDICTSNYEQPEDAGSSEKPEAEVTLEFMVGLGLAYKVLKMVICRKPFFQRQKHLMMIKKLGVLQ